MVNKKNRLVRKLRVGANDERSAIKYYGKITKAEKKRLTPAGRRRITEAKNDEKEHLKYLKSDISHVRKGKKKSGRRKKAKK